MEPGLSSPLDDERVGGLNRTRRAALERAVATWNEDRAGGGTGVPRTCGVLATRGGWAGMNCPNPAGDKTVHRGFGPCWVHGGAKMRGRAEGAWVAAHAFAQQLDVSPWDALLMAVRIAAGKVAYVEWVLSQARSDLELEGRVRRTGEGEEQLLVHPDTGEPLGVGAFRDLSFWVRQSELWHDRLARTAKMAVDAGVAAWLVEKVEADAQAIASVLNAMISGVEDEVSPEVAARMRTLAREHLLALEARNAQVRESTNADAGVVDSTWWDGGPRT